MSKIPKDEIGIAQIEAWYDMAQELKNLKFQESTLRKKIFAALFPNPKEGGANYYDLPDDYKLQGKFSYDRKVDEAVFDNFLDTMVGEKIPVDNVFPPKRTFSKSAYNALNDDQKEMVDECLIIKPASPSMSIKAPITKKEKLPGAKK